MTKEMTRSLPISKWMVYNSYLKEMAKGASTGIDKQIIEVFHENLSGNLNKLWNRLTSGNYCPPVVRTVFTSRKKVDKGSLDISTVSDRIAQGVIKDYLESFLEDIFHTSSFGDRPANGARNAIEQCEENCTKYAWVIHVCIKEFYDNLSHGILLQLLHQHTSERWIMQYAERWLKAGKEPTDGCAAPRAKGTQKDGAISPLFRNIYLHHCFDKWMEETNTQNPFERYGDEIVIHCSGREEAGHLLEKLKVRMQQYELELHPEKTKFVYCKNYLRNDKYDNNRFTFMNYCFQPRKAKGRFGSKDRPLVFNAAISKPAATSIRAKLITLLVALGSNRSFL